MAAVISWTHSWSSSDDGSILAGSDLQNLQSDIENHSHSDATLRWTDTFTDADLSSGVLTVSHNKGTAYVVVFIIDNNGIEILPDSVDNTGANTTDIDLSSYGTLSGTWKVVIF